MALPLAKSYAPMDALLIADIPTGDDWQYEPKWDGFRTLVFREGAKIDLQSKKGQPLARYFPEVVKAVGELNPKKFVLDGELVIPEGNSLSFDALLQRIHPSQSRINKLSHETPAVLILFDMLVDTDGKLLADKPLKVRRAALESFAKKYLKHNHQIVLSPATADIRLVKKWFSGVGGALDGVIAKHLDMPYQSANRTGMVKVKKMRTADCVIGGFRYATNSTTLLGSLLLGLYDENGLLNHVGFCSGFKTDERKKLAKLLEPLVAPPGFTGNAPGGPSRWSTERSTQWQPLKPKLVAEFQYDHFTGGRFRHGTRLLRWRPDKSPKSCTMAQVAQESTVSPLKLMSA